MKYFTFILLFFIYTNSYSQDETLYINNTTSCTYQYTVFAHVSGTDCADNAYQLKTPLTLTSDGAILDQGFAIYGVGTTEWYDYSTAPLSVVLDTDIPAGELRFSAFKMTSGESISVGDCGGNDSDSDSCNNAEFTVNYNDFFGNALVNITLD